MSSAPLNLHSSLRLSYASPSERLGASKCNVHNSLKLSYAAASERLGASKCNVRVAANTAKFKSPPPIQCVASGTDDFDATLSRRSANYKPCIWNNDYLQSLTTHYKVSNQAYLLDSRHDSVSACIQIFTTLAK